MKRIITFVLIVLFSAVSVSAISTPQTHTVTQITDNGTGSVSGSLSWAINASATGDTIVFNLSSGDVVTLSVGLLINNKEFTMKGINIATGNPVTIQVEDPGVSAYRVFQINCVLPATSVTLNDLILKGGDVSGFESTASNSGGVIYNTGYSTLRLNRCIIQDGKAKAGGGINNGSQVEMNQCTVRNNIATMSSGGVFNSKRISIINSSITGNISNTHGGGIYSVAGFTTIINSTIAENSAATYGGGISVAGQGANITLVNSTVSSNSANSGNGSGGGINISANGTFIWLLNSIIVNNTATNDFNLNYPALAWFKNYSFTWCPDITSVSYAPGITTAYTAGDLGALADNGGPTQTMELSASAPAYHAGTLVYHNETDGYYFKGNDNAWHKLDNNGSAPTAPSEADKITTDQRGATRNATPSMGAYGGELATPLFSGGEGTEAAPYKIATLNDLKYLSENSAYWGDGIYFIQTANIDAFDTQNWNSGAGFLPIGRAIGASGGSFNSNYDGQNHTINGLYMNSSDMFAGLFSQINNNTIANLGLTDINFTFTRSDGMSSVDLYGGGFVGIACGATLSNCYTTGTIVYENEAASDNYLAGFMGNAAGTTSCNNCFSTCDVTGANVGGFVGYIFGTVTIADCYSRGKVTSNNSSSTSNAGGFVGTISSQFPVVSRASKISSCYSSGEVSGSATKKGGFAGYIKNSFISGSYYDTESSGMSASYGYYSGGTAGITGLSTAQMKVQANLTALDFSNTWKMDGTNNDGYAYLQWQTFAAAKATPVITWTNPADITYGTALSATQLNATADVEGTFLYNPSVDSVLSVGDNQKLLVEFTPTDAESYIPVKDSVYINVTKSTPVITWATPDTIAYGTALSAIQLNATANVEGTFVYSPAAEVVLTEGTHYLTTIFTPTDTENYNLAYDTVSIVVKVYAPTIQASNITFNTTSSSSINISWTRGNGSTSLIFMAEAATLAATPVDSINYSGNPTYGSGSQIGTTGWYCVRNGESDTSNDGYTITGLTPETEYTVRIFECANLLYNTNTATGNPTNITTTAAAKTPEKILVSGITDPTAANGTYLKGIDMNGKPSWNMTIGDVTYSIYYGSGEHGTIHFWTIDNNTSIEDDAVFYTLSSDDLPPTTGYAGMSGEGDPVLTYQYVTTDAKRLGVNHLCISPNPVKDYLHVKGLTENSVISILNMTGKIFQKEQVSSSSVISVSNLPQGMYVVLVNSGNDNTQLKFIKF